MIITLIAILLGFIYPGTNSAPVVVIPPMPNYSPAISADDKWDDLSHEDYVSEYSDEFTELFNSYETKVAKNGAMMIRRGNSGPFKFARKA